jgi:hypothetical protein
MGSILYEMTQNIPQRTLDDYVKESKTIEECESRIKRIDSGEIKVTYSYGGSNQIITDRVKDALMERLKHLKDNGATN